MHGMRGSCERDRKNIEKCLDFNILIFKLCCLTYGIEILILVAQKKSILILLLALPKGSHKRFL